MSENVALFYNIENIPNFLKTFGVIYYNIFTVYMTINKGLYVGGVDISKTCCVKDSIVLMSWLRQEQAACN